MRIAKKHLNQDYYLAHQFCTLHRNELMKSDRCGWFYCLRIFFPEEIKDWTDENKDGVEQTALCPFCSIDAVIGSASGYPVSIDFLKQMRDFWFDGIVFRENRFPEETEH